MDANPDALLWTEEVARLLGYDRVHTVRREVSATRQHIRTEGRPRVTDFPLPAEEGVLRQVETRDGSRRTVRSSRWRRSDLDAMLEARERNRAEVAAARTRDPASGRLTGIERRAS